MLIDAHIHIFPDKIARATLDHLSAICGDPYYAPGTAEGALAALDEGKADYGVVLPIATKPHQQRPVNDFAKRLQDCSPRLLCFGSVHPDAPDALEELHRVVSLGLRGIKLHPDYQGFFFADERYLPLYREIAALGLPLTLHAGWDPVSPTTHAPASDIAKVAKAIPSLRIVAAHMGSLGDPADSYLHLAGLPNVWLDTAMSSRYLQGRAGFAQGASGRSASARFPKSRAEIYRALILRHGTDRILFATDCPWNTISHELRFLESLALQPEDMENICWKNTARLLGLHL